MIRASWIFLWMGLFLGGVSLSQESGYDQLFRPQVHFSPQRHWTNDPNGLVFFRGEYHLFFQYNPFGDQWGHMSWGHAVSRDLLHWKELPVALPEADGTMIFTGSVIVDHGNTSGLCQPGTECLVAIYTGHTTGAEALKRAGAPAGLETLQTQNLAVSQDAGRNWTKFRGNPVLDMKMADFRDPSVFWDEGRRHWVMAVSLPKEHKVRFYSSADLKKWEQLSEFGPMGDVAGDWECPDLLRIPAATGNGAGMWALKVGLNPGAPQGGSGEQYFLGDFDGRSFKVSEAPGAHGWTNYGKDDYCAISYNSLPKGQKPVLVGWMNNWEYAAKLPTTPWRGQMSLPRELSLVRDGTGLALRQKPILAPIEEPGKVVVVRTGAAHVVPATPFEVHLRFEGTRGTQPYGVRLRSDADHWTDVGFDPEHNEFYVDRRHAGQEIGPGFSAKTRAPLASGRSHDVRLVIDRSSVEAYAQDGTIAMTDLIFPSADAAQIEIFGKGVVAQGEEHRLRSVWGAPSRASSQEITRDRSDAMH